MKLKKFLIIIIILFILTNITCINATENNTHELELNNEKTIEINKNLQNSIENNELSQNYDNQTQPEILTQNNENENILSEFLPVNTQITLTINDTKDLESTGNVTVNMDFSFIAINHNGEFKTHNITIYENNTLLKSLNIGEQNLPELDLIPETSGSHPEINYKANLLFNYTVKSNTYLTTSLWGTYSNTLYFEKIKEISTSSINNNIIIDNTISSNETWTNSIKSLKKAIELVKNNGTITLDNILLIQDINETIKIIKNVTIKSRNSSILLTKTQTLLETIPNIVITFDNITFTGNNKYIISNKGKTIFNNCIFKDNSLGLIDNYGELEINNCQIIDILQFYSDRPTTETGLINNNGKLKITNTIFNNNHYLPYNLPTETTSLKGVIFNKGVSVIDNVNFTNINYRFIYNDGNFKLNNILIENLITASATATYQTIKNETLNTQYTYSNYRIFRYDKTQMYGGAIYNTNNLNISNSKLQNIQGGSGGAIYNTGNLTIENTTLNKTTSITEYAGGIYNTGKTTINNSTISESKIKSAKNGFPATYGGGIYNDGTLNINNTLITKCDSGVKAAGVAIFNNEIMNINNSQITNHEGKSGLVYDNYKSGIIYNSETSKAIITKSIIKDNSVFETAISGTMAHFGVIKNDGEMEISGIIFDNNKAEYYPLSVNYGAVNIYNTGKITVKYSYLLNTAFRSDSVSFLYNTGGGTCNINYNFYCLNPSSIIRNANPNYYFIPTFEDDYYPIKLNQNTNITLNLILTNGVNTIEFNDWDKLPSQGLNTIINVFNDTTSLFNITKKLQDKITFNFNHTSTKNNYTISANLYNYIITTLVDVGKEFPEMTVTYNNITYGEGNITFNITVTGNNTPQNGTITIIFNNEKTQLQLINGTCNFTIPENLKPNTYTVKITYEGNENYFKLRNNLYNFTIFKIPTNITATSPEVKIDQNGLLTVYITPSSAKLTGIIYIDGKKNSLINTQTTTTRALKNIGAGLHNITIIFNDDDYYIGGTVTTWFKVSLYETNMTLTSKDIDAGENVTLNLTISPGDVRGEAILEINGENRTIFINKTTTPITLTNLQNGTYHVTVYYPGDAKYLPSNASTTFNVARKSTQLNVTITNNPDLTGNIIVKTNNTNCTGSVGVYINNDPRLTLNLTQGVVNFTVKFKRGTNLIYIYYLGDNYYSFATWNTTIPIEGKAIITTNQTTITEQNTGNYIIQLKDTDDNPYEYTPITVEFKNQNYTITTNENGIAYYPVTCKAGTYNITITYKNYTNHDTITVKPSPINIDIKDILAGQTEIITVTLANNATGNITFTLDNTSYNRTLTNASTVLEVPNLSLGLHNLTITYSGDKNFINQTITQTFYIKNSISWITLQTENTIYGEAITVKATVIGGATGNVTFQIANQTQTVTLTGNTAEATFKNITAGDKIITAHYNGDSIYQGSDNSIKISVARANTTLEIITSELKVNENILITALVNPDATGNVTFRIQGQYSPRNRTITDGNSSWLISPLNSGSYKLIVIYNGDNNYNSITHEEILIINRIEAKLTIKIGDVSDGDDLMVYATLTDINNRKVTDNITLEINGKYYKIIITNGAGSRNLGEFKAGKYTYSATYNGNNVLAMAIADGEFNVVKSNYKITGNTDITQYYGATKYYKIRLTNNNQPVKNEIITVNINKNTVKIKTDNQGYATLKLSLKAGKYTITSTYKNIKVSNKITVKPTLITKNKKIKKGKTLTYTAKLLNKNGKVLKNKKITFKINGKKYKTKTNKKGIAKIKVKNLKVGKYKILTTYGKQKNTNTITVKK